VARRTARLTIEVRSEVKRLEPSQCRYWLDTLIVPSATIFSGSDCGLPWTLKSAGGNATCASGLACSRKLPPEVDQFTMQGIVLLLRLLAKIPELLTEIGLAPDAHADRHQNEANTHGPASPKPLKRTAGAQALP
jgi:hypothetical protein